jgi:hypothetical protein
MPAAWPCTSANPLPDWSTGPRQLSARAAPTTAARGEPVEAPPRPDAVLAEVFPPGLQPPAAFEPGQDRIDRPGWRSPAARPPTRRRPHLRLVSCLEVAQAAGDAEDRVPGTQHLLLGLLHLGVAANVLDKLGVTRDKVREPSARLLEPAGGGDTGPRVVSDGEAEAAVIGARRSPPAGARTWRAPNICSSSWRWTRLVRSPGSRRPRRRPGPGEGGTQRLDPPATSARPARPPGWAPPTRVAGRACSFCGCTDPEPMVNGPGVRIYGECVAQADESEAGDP